MDKLWKQPIESILNMSFQELKAVNKDTWLYKVLPHLFLELLHKYFRVEIEGADNLPRKGPGLITPNHSGYSGIDAMLLSHEIYRLKKRKPKVLTHHLWFLNKTIAVPANKMGLIEATMPNGLKALNKRQLVILFPEGEFGNFKPTSKAYRLQEFKRGFVRMALETGTPIVPTVVIGAEETHINLRQLELSQYLRGLVLPLPLNIIPLPVKWKIHFLDPIELPYKKEAVNDRDLVHEITEEIRERMQIAINRELRKRKGLFV